ncbi:MAG: hypothetical protein AAGA55_06815, partial [Planctomycetota bacterium]
HHRRAGRTFLSKVRDPCAPTSATTYTKVRVFAQPRAYSGAPRRAVDPFNTSTLGRAFIIIMRESAMCIAVCPCRARAV